MIYIEINQDQEPICLRELRLKGETYTALEGECMAATREVLKSEQYGYCAYCEQRFRSVVHIEHYVSQQYDPTRDLDFSNYLGICFGREYPNINDKNKGKQTHIRHCGNNRGDRELNIDPRIESHINMIYYENDATIKSTDDKHNQDLDVKLNLNFEKLKTDRDEAFKKSYSLVINVGLRMGLSNIEIIEKAIIEVDKRHTEFSGYLKYRYEYMLDYYNTRSEKN